MRWLRDKGQETTCLQNQEVKAFRASLSPQRMPCLIHVPRAWAKSAPSHDSDNIFEIINEVAACLGWNVSLRLLRFFFGGGGCLTWYKYVKAICWMVWVAQIAQELMESKNRGEHTESREVGPKLSWAACSGAAFPKRTPFTPQHFKELTVGQFTIICAVSHWIEWFWLYLYDMCVHETFVK